MRAAIVTLVALLLGVAALPAQGRAPRQRYRSALRMFGLERQGTPRLHRGKMPAARMVPRRGRGRV